jgi:hypothetical protein
MIPTVAFVERAGPPCVISEKMMKFVAIARGQKGKFQYLTE